MHTTLPTEGGLVVDDPVVAAIERQAGAARAVADAVLTAVVAGPPEFAVAEKADDPQAWLLRERSRFLTEGTCDPYAHLMLRRAGFLN